MNLLSKVSYYKIHWIGTCCEIRSALNTLGLYPDWLAEIQNKNAVIKQLPRLVRNLNEEDLKKIHDYGMKLKKNNIKR